jgi:hypothetical protein
MTAGQLALETMLLETALTTAAGVLDSARGSALTLGRVELTMFLDDLLDKLRAGPTPKAEPLMLSAGRDRDETF